MNDLFGPRDAAPDREDPAADPAAAWGRLSRVLPRLARRHGGGDADGEGLSGTAQGPAYVNAPVERGSTVLYESMDEMRGRSAGRYSHQLIYGAMGGPNQFALEEAIAAIEGGTHCQVVPSGLAACTTALLTFLGAGGHCLMPDSVYGPTRRFCDTILKRMGVETTYYDPLIDETGLEELMRPTTQVVFAESPGSHSFEVQDVPMLARVAHAQGAKLLMDNTWGIHVFQPFRHGVDVSIQALTKYPSGHADVVLGAITVRDETDWRVLRDAAVNLGLHGAPDDCWLVLRGLRTLGVRMERQTRTALEVARWLQDREEVARVLHPALSGCPGHAHWRRDFEGASSLFGVLFRPEFRASCVEDMVAALGAFGLGASWGGWESLALPSSGLTTRDHRRIVEGPGLRLHIGLEDPADLIADLEGGLAVLRAAC
ncbi:cystathionine beta-lyase [Rhizosaccharibacter radicis]|uniref:Cystathionine beta-lyase n=1 Tax=Rhizosaccharibacter radicis TaxID=2782605 RepID=A0ABT1VXT7_9PROT|nr:cystathionine beta-lyase [Acetobacteraceae bacterium KSS12]